VLSHEVGHSRLDLLRLNAFKQTIKVQYLRAHLSPIDVVNFEDVNLSTFRATASYTDFNQSLW